MSAHVVPYPAHPEDTSNTLMCSDCWGLLVGEFMHGRAVPALGSGDPS
jgi:hypothetical protein